MHEGQSSFASAAYWGSLAAIVLNLMLTFWIAINQGADQFAQLFIEIAVDESQSGSGFVFWSFSLVLGIVLLLTLRYYLLVSTNAYVARDTSIFSLPRPVNAIFFVGSALVLGISNFAGFALSAYGVLVSIVGVTVACGVSLVVSALGSLVQAFRPKSFHANVETLVGEFYVSLCW